MPHFEAQYRTLVRQFVASRISIQTGTQMRIKQYPTAILLNSNESQFPFSALMGDSDSILLTIRADGRDDELGAFSVVVFASVNARWVLVIFAVEILVAVAAEQLSSRRRQSRLPGQVDAPDLRADRAVLALDRPEHIAQLVLNPAVAGLGANTK